MHLDKAKQDEFFTRMSTTQDDSKIALEYAQWLEDNAQGNKAIAARAEFIRELHESRRSGQISMNARCKELFREHVRAWLEMEGVPPCLRKEIEKDAKGTYSSNRYALFQHITLSAHEELEATNRADLKAFFARYPVKVLELKRDERKTSMDEWQDMLATLPPCPSLLDLKIAITHSNDACVDSLCRSLPGYPQLSDINMGFNDEITGKASPALGHALNGREMERISMHQCGIDDEGIKALLDSGLRAKEIELDHNPFSLEAEKAFIMSDMAKDLKKLIVGKKRRNTKTEDYSNIMKHIAGAPHLQGLQVLQLWNTPISAEAFKAFTGSHTLRDLKRIIVVSEADSSITDSDALELLTSNGLPNLRQLQILRNVENDAPPVKRLLDKEELRAALDAAATDGRKCKVEEMWIDDDIFGENIQIIRQSPFFENTKIVLQGMNGHEELPKPSPQTTPVTVTTDKVAGAAATV